MPQHITLTSPLPADDLRFESMTVGEGLSTLGEMRLALVSRLPDIEPNDLLGRTVSVKLELHEGRKRFFHGHVTRFGMGRPRGRLYGYVATVRPWLWFLTRTADCRIFQDLSVPDIVKKVFEDHGVASFEFKLFRSYRKWTYCVQYRESDFNFVSRLLEHEGIYWYFQHDERSHKLVLVDSSGAHDPAPDCDCLPYYETQAESPGHAEFVTNWMFEREVRAGKVVTTSYDFERPTTSLLSDRTQARSHDLGDYEFFDFQGDFTQADDGSHWVENRIDEQQTRHVQLRGSSNAQNLSCGHLLELERHPREDQNTKVLVTSTAIRAHQPVGEADSGAHGFHCDFTAIPAEQQYRPPRRTPKPFVQGPQTAMVVGPSGDEIYTDKYGRVKVQFHWDRYGRKNEKSSCWVRVSSPWAGKSFGFIQVPRIGQEVVVDFLEGDPDQPLITGRVYNAEQMPPWELPANATQSGVLTRSSKGGAYGNANAIRFEDKKGSEQLWLHAEKNQDIEVENDETHWVGHDRTKTIDHDETTHVKHDRTETVDNNETITVHGQRTETVDKDETITIHQNRTETVDKNETITIGINRTESVGSNEAVTVGANQTLSIGSNRSITVGGSETATVALQRTHSVGVNETIAVGAAQEVAVGAAQSITVGAAQSISVGANQSTSVGAKQSIDVGADRTLSIGGGDAVSVAKARKTSVGEDDNLKVGKNLVIDAGDSVTIKTGSASITMKKDGTITIKGKDITIDGSGKINVKASGDVVVKGSKVLHN